MNPKIKICHVTSAHLPFDVRIFEKECTSLAKDSNYDVYLVAPSAHDYTKNNVHIVGVPFERKYGRYYRMFIFSRKIFKKALELDADIYHFHDPELMPVGLKLMKAGKKVIYDVHEDIRKKMTSKPYIPTLIGYILNILIGWYEDVCVKKFSGVVCATEIGRAHV